MEGFLNRNDLHGYQQYSAAFIVEHPTAALFLDCGLGKTVITLTAMEELIFDRFEICRALVICPLRVGNVWQDEVQKWSHISKLQLSVAMGTAAERKKALNRRADVYIINRENVEWLVSESGIPFDFDMVVIDELSSFKSHKAKRFKALKKVRSMVNRIVGLTGTPAPNGLLA